MLAGEPYEIGAAGESRHTRPKAIDDLTEATAAACNRRNKWESVRHLS